MFDLSGQTAIVTGAAQGIGEAIAHRLAAAGATVAVADLNGEKAEQVAGSLGGKSFPIRLDVASSNSVVQAVEEVVRRMGQIDILVNNAGIAGRAAPLWEQTGRGLAARDRRKFDGRVLLLPRCHSAHAKPEIRANRKHRIDRREGG